MTTAETAPQHEGPSWYGCPSCEGTVSRGVWYSAGSFRLGRYDKGVKRHSLARPSGWREDRDMLTRFVTEHYPDATDFRYKGGVLRFRWNGGEGSGDVYESGTTPGPATWPGTSDTEGMTYR